MMHLMMLMAALGIALALRLLPMRGDWSVRLSGAFVRFLLPPLLLTTTAIAIVWMGPHGGGFASWDGWLADRLAWGWLGVLVGAGLPLIAEARHSIQTVRSCPRLCLVMGPVRLLDIPEAFIAQVGFWQPELVASRGLLERFSPQHLEAILAHEAAHRHYRDTFCFFWLGWLRRASFWLPATEALWQELLALRELRADRWAARRVDHLLLVEALVEMAIPDQATTPLTAAAVPSSERLSERIEALLSPQPAVVARPWIWLALVALLVPLAIVPFHILPTHIPVSTCGLEQNT